MFVMIVMYVCMCICMYVCMYVCMCVSFICVSFIDSVMFLELYNSLWFDCVYVFFVLVRVLGMLVHVCMYVMLCLYVVCYVVCSAHILVAHACMLVIL